MVEPDLAEVIGKTPGMVNELIKGKRPVLAFWL